MAKIFITGSADGLGQMAAAELISKGHEVVLHARNKSRAADAMNKTPGARDVLIADLSSMQETKSLAEKANALGNFDAVIHNAGVYQVPAGSKGAEGWPLVFTVNSLAPYILTFLMHKPQRLVYLSSGMHRQGNPDLVFSDAQKTQLRVSYSDTKFHDLALALAVARLWPDVLSNALDPGWVPTKMGGAGAPDPLQKGFETQVWLATSNSTEATVSGRYFHHKKQAHFLSAAEDLLVQQNMLDQFKAITGVNWK